MVTECSNLQYCSEIIAYHIIAYHIIARTSRIAYQIIDNQIAMSYAINRYAIMWYIFEIGFGIGCFSVFFHSRGAWAEWP